MKCFKRVIILLIDLHFNFFLRFCDTKFDIGFCNQISIAYCLSTSSEIEVPNGVLNSKSGHTKSSEETDVNIRIHVHPKMG